ncbi:histidine kinase [Tenacibaculum aiptasiae]|uniref:Histidine kinase n=1 Tax=Tenacibaculum aiptasiae TaxID=426481 RepID=A0A7J5AP49_9FLAO|nr:histidine kinase [Tenacibaculum aiptasiae]KAB1159381.1 histidine kinase [Tenacibaculum aiptasiae]
MRILFIITYFINITTINDIPNYTGSVIDLSTLEIATLYEGSDKKFIENQLSAKEISSITSSKKGLWYLFYNFKVSDNIINKGDIWLEFRTNINAANLYVNNKLILKNGIIEYNKPALLGGKNLVRRKISKENLISGINTIEIEFTNYKSQSNVIIRDLTLGSLTEFQKHTAIMTTAPTLFLGIFIFVFIINLVLYFSLERKKTFLLLSLLFLVNSFIMINEVMYWNGFVSSTYFISSYTLRSVLEYLSYGVLLIILLYQYNFSKKVIIMSILVFIFSYWLTTLVNINTAIILSVFPLIVSLVAIQKRKKNSSFITLSLVLLFILNYLDDQNSLESLPFVNSNYFITSLIYKLDSIGILVFALVMIFISAKSILHKTKSLSESKLKIEHLEYQFLQKLILPHFMINSLMSLQHLIYKKPKAASNMIEALSEEFHLLSIMNKKKLVPIAQEIDICKVHLKIMSIQQNAEYTMSTKGIIGTETIPPTIIHTLIENGITHGYTGNQNAYFELSKQERKNSTIYRLFNNSNMNTNFIRTSGTGLKYIESRLEECYPDKWQLLSKKVDNGWESIIKIKHK